MVLADAGCEVTLWARRAEVAESINTTRTNPDYLPGVELPAQRTGHHRPGARPPGAPNSVSWPSRPRPCARNLAEWAALLPRDAVLVSLMKGVELGTAKRMSEVIEEVAKAGPERVAVLTGPNLAKEIAERQPAACVVACRRRGGRRAAPGRLPHRRTSARTPTPTWWAANSAARSRTSSASRSASPTAWGSATTPRRR